MKYEDILKLLDAKPFVPLRVQMTDGRIFKSPRRYGVLLTPKLLEIGKNPTRTGIFRDTDFCPVDYISKVEPIKTARREVRRAR